MPAVKPIGRTIGLSPRSRGCGCQKIMPCAPTKKSLPPQFRFHIAASAPQRLNTCWRQEYDLLIVDEAHKLKHRSTQRFKFVSRIKKKYVLMLTATPVHNDLTELYNLITILKPGLLGTIRAFKRHFVASRDARRPKNEQQLKKLLAGVMVRNRRSDVNIKFPARNSAIYHLTLTDKERELYESVSEYIRTEFKAQTHHQFHLLSLTTLQKELCSSSRAVASTLEKMAGRDQYPKATQSRLRSFIALADDIVENRKIEALLEILGQFPGKFLVFTEFLHTMHYIREHLETRDISTQLSLWRSGFITTPVCHPTFCQKRPRNDFHPDRR